MCMIYDPKDVEYTQERYAFVAFIKELEMGCMRMMMRDQKDTMRPGWTGHDDQRRRRGPGVCEVCIVI